MNVVFYWTQRRTAHTLYVYFHTINEPQPGTELELYNVKQTKHSLFYYAIRETRTIDPELSSVVRSFPRLTVIPVKYTNQGRENKPRGISFA